MNFKNEKIRSMVMISGRLAVIILSGGKRSNIENLRGQIKGRWG